MARQINRTKRFTHPQRNNSGVILPQFALHAALLPMVESLANGSYGKGNLEEPIVSVIGGLSQRLIDRCFASLQRRPPTIALQFPMDPAVLPWITIATDAMVAEGPVMDDYTGHIDEEILTIDTAFALTPSGGAVGGETVFALTHQDVISRMLELTLTHSGSTTVLDLDDGDFSVDSTNGRITLASALSAGDVLTCLRYGYYGLPGGDLFGTMFRFEHVILIDTVNPILTNFLQALVWRELMLGQAQLLRAGLVDSSFGVRSNSIWEQMRPAIGHRIELTISGLTTWQVYSRSVDARVANVNIDTTSGVTDVVELVFDLPTWGDEEESVL